MLFRLIIKPKRCHFDRQTARPTRLLTVVEEEKNVNQGTEIACLKSVRISFEM